MIVLKDINKELNGKKILKDITFHIAQGEKIGIVGLNGAGKTTLLNIIAGLLRPSEGFIRVSGAKNLLDIKESLKSVSYISGTRSQLWEDLMINASYENLAKMYDINHKELITRIENLSKIFDVDKYLKARPKDLSLGERMRCELVYGLLVNPKLLLIDEALIGLDVSVKFKIMQFFENYKEQTNSTILYTSNNLSEVERICDRVIVIDQGEIIYDGTTQRALREFAPLYKIKLVLEGRAPDLGDLPIERFVLDNDTLSVEYDKNKVDTSQIIKHVMEKCIVRDVVLYEPNLENVIKKIYDRKEYHYGKYNWS